jgi:malate/lactate dehydrogenase
MRARAFVAEAMGVPPDGVDVPVIGGHAGETILPLLSQATPAFAFTEAEATALTVRIQNAGTEARRAACA